MSAAGAGDGGGRLRIDDFVAGVVAPAAARMAQGEGPSPNEVVLNAGEYGLAGVLTPAALGGAGASHVDFAHVIEAVARQCASTSVILDVHLSVASEPILIFGNTQQKQRFLPRLASGEWLGAFALTEPGSGSDAAALSTRAERRGGSFVLTGRKAFITNAGCADLYIVLARTGEGPRGISAFLVEKGASGLSFGEPLHKMGLRGSVTGELILDDVVIDGDNLLGEEGQGFRVAMAALDSGRIGISAQAVGIAEGCLDAVLAHARTGAALDETALADLAARVAAARRLCLDAAAAVDAGVPVTRLASVAKLYATDTCMAAAQTAMDLCGPGAGLESAGAAIRFRDAKACQIYEGTNQIQRVVIARELLRS